MPFIVASFLYQDAIGTIVGFMALYAVKAVGFARGSETTLFLVLTVPAIVGSAAAALQRTFGNSRMTGSGSAVFARAGSGPMPSAAMPGDWPSDWSSRMCRSLERHPLAGWVRRSESGEV